ncbi:MAG: prolipoprotein diacylglyceryl transferase [Ruminococcus sp.]|nr:prolipoprotein diacylglyceryl transferase [Ruminococcus sp.]MCM1479629.1 prolipoprotein diacylglyceryl transferase [Muribaculaceae bacterium]
MTNAEWNTLSFPELGIELPVYSTAFSIFGFDIKWYGICITLGAFLAVLYCFKRMKSFGVDDDRAVDVVFLAAIGGVVGARLYYVFMRWDEYRDDLSKIVTDIRSGGLAIYGGIIGAVLVGAIVAKIRKVRLAPLLDLAGMGFLIGQACGRWGNFFNHECFGRNTSLPWGMTSPKIQADLQKHIYDIYEATGVEVDPALPVHPCFLYESLWCVLGFVLLHLYSKRRKFDGELFFMYIGWYGLGRVFIEGLRTDSLMVGHLRISQLVAGICVAASIAVIFAVRHKIKMDGEYVFYKDTDEFKRIIAETEEKYKAAEEKQAAKKAAKKRPKDDGELRPEDRLVDDENEEENENGEDN